MNIAARTTDATQRVYLVLTDTARCLTSQELLKITEVAEQAHAIVHIHRGSWQVLVKVPELSYQEVDRALQAMGHAAQLLSGKINERSTFVLKRERQEHIP
jgi:hypothetical protein